MPKAKALRELLSAFISSRLYLFLPFLGAKSQIRQKKSINRNIALQNNAQTNLTAVNFAKQS